MAEESDFEKTEPPSPKRLEQAREEGQVARSPELGTFAVLATGCAALWLLGDQIAEGMWAVMRAAMNFDRAAAFGDQSAIERLVEQSSAGLMVLMPLLGVLAVRGLNLFARAALTMAKR